MRKLLAGGAVVAVAVLGPIAAAAPAAADPGFCGVRVDGPSFVPSTLPAGLNGYYVYTAKNQCRRSVAMTAVILTRPNFCETFAPGEVRSFNSVGNDRNWTMTTCSDGS
jgi:hypothetical protein